MRKDKYRIMRGFELESCHEKKDDAVGIAMGRYIKDRAERFVMRVEYVEVSTVIHHVQSRL